MTGVSRILCSRAKQYELSENIGKGAEVKNRPLYRHISGSSAICQGTGRLSRHPVSEVDSQLCVDHAPVLAPACPFSGNVHHSQIQIQHLQQAVVRRENRFSLAHFPQLTAETLNGVRGINQPPDLLRVFEISIQIVPVISSEGGDFGIFLDLRFGEPQWQRRIRSGYPYRQ